MPQTDYGDISPRTAAYAQKELLERGLPYLLLEKFGDGKPVPTRSTKATKFRRYEALTTTPAALTEGVTPAAEQLTFTDITATLVQYGNRVQISDVIQDTHEDPVMSETMGLLGEQAGQMIEVMRYGIVNAGTNVFYANGGARNAVNTPITTALQRQATRALRAQNGMPHTRVVRSTPSYGTAAIQPSYIGICHTDVENDIRDMTGFVASENYGTITPFESEIGKVEGVRYLCSSIYDPIADAGGAAGGSYLSTTGTNADVYPVLILARHAYGIVPLKGKSAVTPMVVNPKPSDSDPLAQRGHAGWKSMQTAVILNDLWIARLEVAATA